MNRRCALSNPAAPSGADFTANTFSWTAGAGCCNTTNILLFVADDGQGATNSVVTNRADIVVPRDWDGDGVPDGWEWTHFQTLNQSMTEDTDHDGVNNYDECIAGTQPTNEDSFCTQAMGDVGGAPTRHLIVVPTSPGRKYTLYFTDSEITNGATWATFANLADGMGTWMETNTVPGTYTFVDDESSDTTGGSPVNGRRYYRVKVVNPDW